MKTLKQTTDADKTWIPSLTPLRRRFDTMWKALSGQKITKIIERCDITAPAIKLCAIPTSGYYVKSPNTLKNDEISEMN